MTSDTPSALHPLPRVRLHLGDRSVTLFDSPLVRAAVALLEAVDAVPAMREGEIDRQQVHLLGKAFHRFMRALLGPAASDEVVDGLVYVALLHRVEPR